MIQNSYAHLNMNIHISINITRQHDACETRRLHLVRKGCTARRVRLIERCNFSIPTPTVWSKIQERCRQKRSEIDQLRMQSHPQQGIRIWSAGPGLSADRSVDRLLFAVQQNDRWQRLPFGNESQRHRIHAVPCILRGHPFA